MDVQCGTINSRRVAGARVKYTPQVVRITDVSLKVEIPPKTCSSDSILNETPSMFGTFEEVAASSQLPTPTIKKQH